MHDLWLAVSKRTNGGYCWVLTRTLKESIVEVIMEAFTAYGFRWKIEEYQRHIKECIVWNTSRSKHSKSYRACGITDQRDEHIYTSLILAHKVIA